MTGQEIGFAVLGALALGAGALAVTTTRPVRAVLWLAACLAAVAGCFLVLAAELVAWTHVLVYIGAVVVLLLFALLLTHAPAEPRARAAGSGLVVAGAVAAATAAVLLAPLLGAFGGERIDPEAAAAATPEALGRALFGGWVLPFEALSMLLLAGLVGAVALTRGTQRRHLGRLSGRTTQRPGTRPRALALTAEETRPPGGGG